MAANEIKLKNLNEERMNRYFQKVNNTPSKTIKCKRHFTGIRTRNPDNSEGLIEIAKAVKLSLMDCKRNQNENVRVPTSLRNLKKVIYKL